MLSSSESNRHFLFSHFFKGKFKQWCFILSFKFDEIILFNYSLSSVYCTFQDSDYGILDRFLIFIFLSFIVFSCKVGGFAMCFRTQVRHDLQCTISGESPCLPLSQLYNYKEV